MRRKRNEGTGKENTDKILINTTKGNYQRMNERKSGREDKGRENQKEIERERKREKQRWRKTKRNIDR